MIKLLILIGLNIFAALIAFTSTEGLFNHKKPNQPIFGRKRRFILTPKGIALAVAFLGTTALSIWQYAEDENEKRTSKQENDKELKRRDSLARVDQDRRDSAAHVNTVTALAKYGLKYDSAQKTIEKLVRDSSKMTYVSAANPDFGLCSENQIILHEVKDNNYYFRFSFCNKAAASGNIIIGIKAVIETFDGRFLVLPGNKNLLTIRKLSVDSRIQGEASINGPGNLKNIYFYLNGAYTNDDGSKRFLVDDVYWYEIATKNVYIPEPEKDKEIRERLGIK